VFTYSLELVRGVELKAYTYLIIVGAVSLGKKDVVYIIVIIMLLFLALSSSGLLPVTLPFIKHKTPVTVYSPVIITHTKVITKTPTKQVTTETKTTTSKHPASVSTTKKVTSGVRVVTRTVTATLIKTKTLVRTKTVSVRETLTTTLYITSTTTKTVKVPYYPREPFKNVIKGFLAPGDVVAINISSKYLKTLYSNLPLFYSVSSYDANVGKVLCNGGTCIKTNTSFDGLGKSLMLKLTSSKATVTIKTMKPMNISNGILYVFMYIPGIEEYIKQINNLTMRIEVKEPRLLTPIIYVSARYVAQGQEVPAKPILFRECAYGWYVAEFKVSGVGITEVSIVFRNYVMFIKYIDLDKIVLLNALVNEVKVCLEPPVGILHDLIMNRTYKPVVCDDICVYRVPISWDVVIKTSSGSTLSKRVINATYTIVFNKKKGEILSVTPTKEFLTFTEKLNIIDLLRDVPGVVEFLVVVTPH